MLRTVNSRLEGRNAGPFQATRDPRHLQREILAKFVDQPPRNPLHALAPLRGEVRGEVRSLREVVAAMEAHEPGLAAALRAAAPPEDPNAWTDAPALARAKATARAAMRAVAREMRRLQRETRELARRMERAARVREELLRQVAEALGLEAQPARDSSAAAVSSSLSPSRRSQGVHGQPGRDGRSGRSSALSRRIRLPDDFELAPRHRSGRRAVGSARDSAGVSGRNAMASAREHAALSGPRLAVSGRHLAVQRVPGSPVASGKRPVSARHVAVAQRSSAFSTPASSRPVSLAGRPSRGGSLPDSCAVTDDSDGGGGVRVRSSTSRHLARSGEGRLFSLTDLFGPAAKHLPPAEVASLARKAVTARHLVIRKRSQASEEDGSVAAADPGPARRRAASSRRQSLQGPTSAAASAAIRSGGQHASVPAQDAPRLRPVKPSLAQEIDAEFSHAESPRARPQSPAAQLLPLSPHKSGKISIVAAAAEARASRPRVAPQANARSSILATRKPMEGGDPSASGGKGELAAGEAAPGRSSRAVLSSRDGPAADAARPVVRFRGSPGSPAGDQQRGGR